MTADLTDPNGRKVKAKEDTVGKYSSGPLSIDEVNFRDMQDDPDYHICVCKGDTILADCGTHAAFALLVAGSEQLLKACREAYEYLYNIANDPRAEETAEVVRLAIAKATE